jgi:hypothetical protein
VGSAIILPGLPEQFEETRSGQRREGSWNAPVKTVARGIAPNGINPTASTTNFVAATLTEIRGMCSAAGYV